MKKINFLVAYPYMNQRVIDALISRKNEIDFLLDSGAFTAWKAGKPIALDDYCKFIESLPIKPWRYFTLDVIGDPEASMKNYEIMIDRGFKPLPIFTRGENHEMLEKYYETSDVVGIGGLVGTQKNKAFVNGIMKKVGKRKVHWLGFTSIDFIKTYKPYMCDSSSWSSGIRYGALSLYKGYGKFERVTKKQFLENPSDYIKELIKKHGINPQDLAFSEHWVNRLGTSALRTSCFRSWAMFQDDVVKNTGTKFFLACASEQDIKSFFDAFDWLRKGKNV